MELFETIYSRRPIRTSTVKEIQRSELEMVVDAADLPLPPGTDR